MQKTTNEAQASQSSWLKQHLWRTNTFKQLFITVKIQNCVYLLYVQNCERLSNSLSTVMRISFLDKQRTKHHYYRAMILFLSRQMGTVWHKILSKTVNGVSLKFCRSHLGIDTSLAGNVTNERTHATKPET